MPNFSIDPNPNITYKVRHEDDHLLVVEKPARMVTQPGLGHERDSLLNGLFATYGNRLQNLGKDRDFGLLHRLDKNASGLLIVALRTPAYDTLREAFETRSIKKYYWAVCKGAPTHDKGVIRKPIAEDDPTPHAHTRGEKKTARISRSGKPAITAYRVLQKGRGASLIECAPATGRLHQVRVHLDAIGCPILGDDIYSAKQVEHAAPRLALHAHRLVFNHPDTGEKLDVRSVFPRDLRGLLKRLALATPPVGDSAQNGHHGGGDAIGHEDPGVRE